jgi:subtilisin
LFEGIRRLKSAKKPKGSTVLRQFYEEAKVKALQSVIFAVFLLRFPAVVYGQVSSEPNLTPYQPTGWSDKIVVSNVQGTNTDSLTLSTTDTIYVDFAEINDGNAATAARFYSTLYVDGVGKFTGYCDPPLNSYSYCYWQDITIGSLLAGTHTIKLVVDSTNTIIESNEYDNEYTKTILVQGGSASLPNLRPYQPLGWSDKIVVSNVKGTNTDALSLTPSDSIYVDWAVINDGNVATTATFYTQLYVDGVAKAQWRMDPPLNSNNYIHVEDYLIGSLSTGTHTIKIVADSTNTISESNEFDNEYIKTITVTAEPNLTPFQPSGWTDKIVVSTVTGTNFDSSNFKTTDTLYVDWAVINNGEGATSASFQIKLYVDGREVTFWNSSPPLDPSHYIFVQDYSIGSLSAGVHAIRIVADPFNAIVETNETDNDYTKTINVTEAAQCFTLFTTLSPTGSGTITKSQPPTCGGGAFDLQSAPPPTEPLLMTADSRTNLPAVSRRSQTTIPSFASLKEKVHSQGRVSVIVGLQAEFSPEGMLKVVGAVLYQRNLILQAQDSLLDKLSKHKVTSIRKYKFIPYLALEVDAAGLQFLEDSPEVTSISENEFRRALLPESVPLIGAPTSWNSGFSGAGQTIAIVDSGVDKNHPFLAGKVVSEACYSTTNSLHGASSVCPGGAEESTAEGSGMPCSAGNCFHGTHVAGIAAGKGATFSGVARDANVISIQVASLVNDSALCKNITPCAIYQDRDILAGLDRIYELATNGAFRVAAVNISLGGGKYSTNCDSVTPQLKAAIDNLRSIGIATVIASGNDTYLDSLGSPACISSAISVGSTDDGSEGTNRDSVSDFSNSASFLNLLAPGRVIYSSIPGGGYYNHSGTSMAAPHVAGAWAILKSKVPNASVSQVLSALTSTGVPISDIRNGIMKPRIQVDAALNALAGGEAGYSSGTNVTLTAVPNAGYQFKSWSGCDSVSGTQCTVAMTKSGSVTANFEPLSTPGADLVLNSLSGSSTVPVGGQISLAAEVKNQGSGNAGPFRIGFYLSVDASVTTDDTLFAVCEFSTGLGAGLSATCSGPVSLPSNLTPGIYYLGAIVDDQGKVAETNEGNNTRVGQTVSITSSVSSILFVPIVLSAAGLNGSFFTSEMILTNKGSQDAPLSFNYNAAFGSGSGTSTDILPAGQQRVISDAIGYLRSIGMPIPITGSQGGTLTVQFSGLSSPLDGAVTVRTSTAVANGRAGLAYSGIPVNAALNYTVYLCGLRQNQTDRSNVAVQNVGGPSQGNIVIRLTVYSGDLQNPGNQVLPLITLSPGGFYQVAGILQANGINFQNGYVKVERISGTAPFYAYGVINDQVNSDGSFVVPQPAATTPVAGLTLPVVVQTSSFLSELVLTNWSNQARTINFALVADSITTADKTARFAINLPAGQQLIIPDIFQYMRDHSVPGVGPAGTAIVGALFATATGGDLSGVVIGARTSTPGGGGRYGLFYPAVLYGQASTDGAWLFGLQQNSENRTNLAVVNTGEGNANSNTFVIDLYDGATGVLVKTMDPIVVQAHGWAQMGSILNFAPGVQEGYAHIRRTLGTNPFITYAVINDGAGPGQRTGDGAFIASAP